MLKKYKLIWLIVLILLLVYMGRHKIERIFESSLLDVEMPADTAVILQTSTITGYHLNFSPRSKIYFYNQNGEIVGSAYEPEEVLGDFIEESSKEICYFFKNHSVLTDGTSVKSLENSSGTTIENTKFGPSQIGYIEEHDTFYSLFNAGAEIENIAYSNILRFVSKGETYDVILPYFIDGVCYDEGQQKLICVLAFAPVENCDSTYYVIVSWDDLTKKFVYQEDLHCFSRNPQNADIEYFSGGYMARDGRFYHVITIPEDEENIYGKGSMVLEIYDLETGNFISQKTLLEDYELGSYAGMLVGSSAFPSVEKCGKLYVFSASNQVFIIEDENNIEIRNMPYVFEDKLPLSNPNDRHYVDSKNFTESLVCVGEDGEIYILSLFKDDYLKIHKLLNTGQYEVVWKGKIMPDLDKDMSINSFELLYDTE